MEEIYQSSVILIRHGQTKRDIDSKYKNRTIVRTSKDYIELSLNETGRLQSEQLQRYLQNERVVYVFCSPAGRCLETCLLSLKGHPDKDKFKIFVFPFLSECSTGVNGFCIDMKYKKTKFNLESEIKFDWVYFDTFFPDLEMQDLFFLNFYKFEKTEHFSKIQDLNLKDSLENRDMLLDKLNTLALYFSEMRIRPENYDTFYERTTKVKKFLKSFIKINKIKKNENILVFTHSTFAKMFTSESSEKLYECRELNFLPDDCYELKNCEMINFKI
jgi:hypothetical protein